LPKNKEADMFRHFLDISDYEKETLMDIVEQALSLKKKQKDGQILPYFQGKTLGLLFDKPSLRTKVSFEVGMHQLGGNAIQFLPQEVGMGTRESIEDVARVLSRFVDQIVIRTFSHQDLLTFAANATVPVINGLTDRSHPCQALADALTIYETFGEFNLKMAYIGDGNNVCRSLVEMAFKLGIDITVSCPDGFFPDTPFPFTKESNPIQAVKQAHVVYTDVWISMGQEEQALKRKKQFSAYTVTQDMMAIAHKNAIFMHCLPAHRGEEVSNEVLESYQSKVFDQAENRLHAQKALMLFLSPQRY